MKESSGRRTRYTLYKMDVSYFSGKLEAYLRCKGVPYEPVEVDARLFNRIYAATGTKKVPAVRTPERQWLFDTTPTIDWFEREYPEPSLTPADPALAFVAALVEDYADEWLWRPAMWWRWEPPVSRRALGRLIAESIGLPGVPARWVAWFFAVRQRRAWLWGDGVTRRNAGQVRDLYLQELDLLEEVLAQQPYLFGSRPCRADFGYFGPMFRHFGNDPDPAEVMRRRAPGVYLWLARLWHGAADGRAGPPAWRWPDSAAWQPLWARIAGDYLPYLHRNAVAYRDGAGRFDFRGATLSLAGTVTNRYRVWCRQELQRRYHRLEGDDRRRIDALFAPHGGLDALQADGVIDSGMEERFVLPRPEGRYRQPLRVALLGQPRD